MERYFVFGYIDYEEQYFVKYFDTFEEATEFAPNLQDFDAYYIYNIEMQKVENGRLS